MACREEERETAFQRAEHFVRAKPAASARLHAVEWLSSTCTVETRHAPPGHLRGPIIGTKVKAANCCCFRPFPKKGHGSRSRHTGEFECPFCDRRFQTGRTAVQLGSATIPCTQQRQGCRNCGGRKPGEGKRRFAQFELAAKQRGFYRVPLLSAGDKTRNCMQYFQLLLATLKRRPAQRRIPRRGSLCCSSCLRSLIPFLTGQVHCKCTLPRDSCCVDLLSDVHLLGSRQEASSWEWS